MERNEKEVLCEKSKDIDKLLIENTFMEFSLSRLNDKLDRLRAIVMKFQESCQVLLEEKTTLVDEKSSLLSQLQIVTESMQKLLEKNSLLEKSLSDAKTELEGRTVVEEDSMNVEHKLDSCETDQHDVTEENRQGYTIIKDIITCHRSNNSERYPNPNYSSELEAEKELGIDKLEFSKIRKEISEDNGKRKILERLALDAQRLAIL
ncbi:hypothetical protein RJT34_12941 [Clitoria ternatea]|uniref:Uncharacterized protein n=1 Tax=Clitoria ternatea TaxID=43366 RepID=A0AAN9JQR4_CLITE